MIPPHLQLLDPLGGFQLLSENWGRHGEPQPEGERGASLFSCLPPLLPISQKGW